MKKSHLKENGNFSVKSGVYKAYAKRFKGINRIIAVYFIIYLFFQLNWSFSTLIRGRNFSQEAIQIKKKFKYQLTATI